MKRLMKRKKSRWFDTLYQRWSKSMPPFFKKMMKISALISGTALAVNEAMQLAGVTPDDWWSEILKYLVAVPAGIMFACKFAVSGGMPEDKEENNKKIQKDNL
jgi:hypothetical protein